MRNSILTSGYFFKIYFALFSFGSKLRAQLGLKPLFLEDQSNATTAMTTTNVQKKGGETSSNRRVSSLLNSCGNNDRHYIYFQGGLIWSVLASLPSFYYPIWGEGRRGGAFLLPVIFEGAYYTEEDRIEGKGGNHHWL